MKLINNYRVYLVLSLVSLFTGALLNIFQVNSSAELLAVISFLFFSIAVSMVALEEFFSVWKK